MKFINEDVSEQDIEKYGLREINKRLRATNADFHWTINEDRDIYLRRIGSGGREDPYVQYMNFYWKGNLLPLQFLQVGEGVRGGKGSTT